MSRFNSFCFILLALLHGAIAFAADSVPSQPEARTAASTQNTIDEVKERVAKLETEFAVEKQTTALVSDGVDKRLADFATLATMQGSHTSWVGTLVAVVSIMITIFVFGAGFVTYVSVKNRAIREAQEVAEAWFKSNTEELNKKFRSVEERVNKALSTIAAHEEKVETDAADAKRKFDETLREKLREVDRTFKEKRADRQDSAGPVIEDSLNMTRTSAELSSLADSTSVDLAAEKHFNFAAELYKHGDFTGAVAEYDMAIRCSGGSSRFDQAKYIASKGLALQRANLVDQAIQTFESVERRFAKDVDAGVQAQVAFSLMCLITLHELLGQKDKEKELLDILKERYGDGDSPDMRFLLSSSLYRDARNLGETNDFQGELSAMQRLLDVYGADDSTDMQMVIASVMFSKANALIKLDRSREAIDTYEAIERKFSAAEDEHTLSILARSMLYRAIELRKVATIDEELKLYDEIFSRFSSHSSESLRDIAADALVYKGLRLGGEKRFNEEIGVYNELDRRFANDTSPLVRGRVAEGVGQKAVSQSALNMNDVALETFDEVDRRFGSDSLPHTRTVVAETISRKAELLYRLGRNDEARNLYALVVERYKNERSDRLVKLVKKATDQLTRLT